MVAHNFNPSAGEEEAGRSLWVWCQPGPQSEFQDSQGCYKETLSQKPIPNKQKNQTMQIALVPIPNHSQSWLGLERAEGEKYWETTRKEGGISSSNNNLPQENLPGIYKEDPSLNS